MNNNEKQTELLATAVNKGTMKLQKCLDQHAVRVLSIRKGISVKNSELISDELKSKIPFFHWYVKGKVSNLRSELKEIIWGVATDHENKRFSPLRKDFEQMNGVSKLHLERGSAILENEQKMLISYHSLFFACKACSDLNKEMLGQIDNLRLGKQKAGNELELLLKNAIIVFEVTSLLIEMIQQFQLQGFQEFQSLKEVVLKELLAAEINSQRNVDIANNPVIPPHQKVETITRHRNLKESANLVRMQWQRFEDQMWSMQQNAGELAQRLPSLALTRDNAKVQLDFLELVAVTQMMNQNIQAIEGMANLELELAPLSPYDVCRLIGLETAALVSSQPQDNYKAA